MSRTVMTAATTALSLLALVLFGGQAIQGFAQVMLYGVVICTYSAICISSPMLDLYRPARIGDREGSGGQGRRSGVEPMSSGRLYDGFLPGRYQFDAYGNGGFRFADMSHRGSLLALPSGVRAWPVASMADLTDEVLDPIFTEGDALELLLFGTGLDIAALPARSATRFREAGIGLDVMQTGAAARTYNILLAENRKVGAALIAVP